MSQSHPSLQTNPDFITDVSDSTWTYLVTRRRWPFAIYTLIAVALSIALGFAAQVSLIIIIWVVYGLWIGSVRSQVQRFFMEQFAEANKLTFEPDSSPSRAEGWPFRFGHSPKACNFIRGNLGSCPFELFLYQHTIGQGRYQQQVNYTVLSLDLGKTVPRLFAFSLARRISEWTQVPIGTPTVPPEDANAITFGNQFDKYYQVKVPPKQETEALQILEPDVMQQLIEQPCHFNFELANQSLYIYHNRYITKRAELDSFFSFAKAIASKIEHEVSLSDFDVPVKSLSALPVRQPSGLALQLQLYGYVATGLGPVLALIGLMPVSNHTSETFLLGLGVTALGIATILVGRKL